MWTFIQHQVEQAIDGVDAAKKFIATAERRAKEGNLIGARLCAAKLHLIAYRAEQLDRELREIALYCMVDAKLESEQGGSDEF